jgi:uncharacterized protein YdhG (YjbR/CyaY superfamily)
MPAKNATTESDGFSAEERAAMKKRAAELRAEGKKGAKKADGLQAVLDSIAEMAPGDRALAECVHMTVTAAAPGLSPKTWYGMPAYANADGKVVVFFQNAGKFSYRYSTLGFQDAANLDDGDMWPVSYALKKVSWAMTSSTGRPGSMTAIGCGSAVAPLPRPPKARETHGGLLKVTERYRTARQPDSNFAPADSAPGTGGWRGSSARLRTSRSERLARRCRYRQDPVLAVD